MSDSQRAAADLARILHVLRWSAGRNSQRWGMPGREPQLGLRSRGKRAAAIRPLPLSWSSPGKGGENFNYIIGTDGAGGGYDFAVADGDITTEFNICQRRRARQ